MGEGYCTQSYPCICKEAVSGFEPMTNKSPRHNFTAAPRHNFTAAPGLALCLTPPTIINFFFKKKKAVHAYFSITYQFVQRECQIRKKKEREFCYKTEKNKYKVTKFEEPTDKYWF